MISQYNVGYTSRNFNMKKCLMAKDLFHQCVDNAEGNNKYLCPNEYYLYQMWCPELMMATDRFKLWKYELETEMYTAEEIKQQNQHHATAGTDIIQTPAVAKNINRV